jgi:hypothetical protein
MATATRRSDRLAADQKLNDGVKQYLAQTASMTVDGQSMTPTAIVAFLQGRIDAAKAVSVAEAAQNAAIKGERDVRGKSSTTRSALVRLIVGMFLSSPDTLAAFGISAPKVGTMSVEAKAKAIAKSKATREARHTMGKVQKLAITGSPAAASNGAPPATPATAQPKV